MLLELKKSMKYNYWYNFSYYFITFHSLTNYKNINTIGSLPNGVNIFVVG